ncbi:guanine nucleotide exchange factor for Rab-3A-like isoform X1 [Syngnathus typhle]|uniref:guanine nucleotide exchange factor for Rab-3A-like isoform X1 n=1 Tax=Syngnathus typhle TaxID=161592 RepID=UPI002A6B50C7|nr:guanine nucleotide exchange factor for Rab-3A-like isoform X1 [Syngnathus typhle]XP_061140331.1 guanine nucleotide exchange factor for Rab-3A-like isoform X1 [Syngnathus typhle]
MDAFEGIHSVRISPSPPPPTSSGRAYEVLKAGRSGIAVYSSAVFFGTPSEAEEKGCVVGRLVDLDPEPDPRLEGRGQVGPTLDIDHEVQSRVRSTSLEMREKEIREKGSEILSEQLDAAKKELKLKDKECERLSQVRIQLEQELEELTASLFEEAHKMVREANVKQAGAEKQLKEAQGKIDVLQAEVTVLKSLVLTSTPSAPNRQLHPQLQLPIGGNNRNKSMSGGFPSPPGKPDPPSLPVQPVVKEDREMDSVLYAEFLMWKEHPSLDRSSALMSRIYREDIGPCLSFTRSELSQLVQSAVENNSLTIEPVAMSALPIVKASAIECGGPNYFRAAVETKCALSGVSRQCRHRIKLGDKGNYYYISPSSRARITAVCNFFTYIRYIQQGLVRHNAEQMFWEVMRLRREMSVAKLGFFLTEQS